MALRHLQFALLSLAFVPASVTAAVVLDEVPVRVYDSTGLDEAVRGQALATSRVTLARAGVAVAWLSCDRHHAAPECGRGTRPGELVLRIVRANGSRGPTGAAGVRSAASLLPLGDAFVDLGAQSGVLATVYLDRIRTLADAARIDVATLLGYAIAHEIGHLLLGTNAHGTGGLMRPLWSRDEIRRGRDADWNFTESEKEAIRARLAASRVWRD